MVIEGADGRMDCAGICIPLPRCVFRKFWSGAADDGRPIPGLVGAGAGRFMIRGATDGAGVAGTLCAAGAGAAGRIAWSVRSAAGPDRLGSLAGAAWRSRARAMPCASAVATNASGRTGSTRAAPASATSDAGAFRRSCCAADFVRRCWSVFMACLSLSGRLPLRGARVHATSVRTVSSVLTERGAQRARNLRPQAHLLRTINHVDGGACATLGLHHYRQRQPRRR